MRFAFNCSFAIFFSTKTGKEKLEKEAENLVVSLLLCESFLSAKYC